MSVGVQYSTVQLQGNIRTQLGCVQNACEMRPECA